MNHRNTRLILSLAVLSALAACGGQESKEQKPASAPTEASAVQTTPNAASATPAASQAVVDSNASPEDQELLKRAQGIFKPLPSAEEMQKLRPFTEEQVKLGHQLWYEPRLSKGNTVSCNSCHNLATAGVDNLPTSQGHKGQFGGRNSPTALNAALLGMQFWDGRAADVEEQAGGPLVNPVEMANDSQEAAAAKIAKIPEYQELFKTAFPEDGAVSFKNITTALGAFERTLLTPTKWDDYLKGNVNALNEQERKGVRAFMDNGCLAAGNGGDLNLAKARSEEVKNNVGIEVLTPKGMGFWIESWLIPADAKNIANAHKYINYTLDPEVAAKNGIAVTFAPASKPAREKMPAELVNTRSIFPNAQDMKDGFVMPQMSSDAKKLSVNLWQKIKVGSN